MSEKLVRCYVSRAESEGGDSRSVRYVPLEIYGLWEHLMAGRHGFAISNPETSLWFEARGTDSSEADLPIEPVNRVEVFYFTGDDGMLHQDVRFFPASRAAEYEAIRDGFLAHYRTRAPARSAKLQYKENAGVWIIRQDVPTVAGAY